ncbi:MAG: PilN domain-containing protein [Gammaproteobacteria bacterium]|nr:PilN domain-containing protein [Gammaproteobacteria bacterium]
MYQTINLLPKLQELPKQKFSVDVMFLGLVGFLLALTLLSGILFWISSANKKTITKLQAVKQEMSKQLVTVKAELNKYVADEKTQIDSNSQLERVEQMLVVVQAQQNASVALMSQYLKGLAENTPAGVWLESINIMPIQKRIDLKGMAIRSSMIPAFIKELNNSPSFSEEVFNTLHATKTTDKQKQTFVSFELSTNKTQTEGRK